MRNKTCILIDDVSAHPVMSSNTNNPMYELFSTRRHLGVYHTIASIHNVTTLYGKNRDHITSLLLFGGIRE